MRRILILIVLASLAVTAAGCGSKPSSPSVAAIGSTTTTSSQGGAAPASSEKDQNAPGRYSACMRSHGVPKFPDPTRSGGGMNLSIGPNSGIDPNSAVFKAADKTCRKLLPNGGTASPADQAKAQAQMLKFSACMRSHGLPDFPDPQISGGGIKMSIGKGLNPNSPLFKAAQKACQSLMLGPKNGPGGNTQLQSGGGGPATSSGGGK